jgi:splicing factor, arginine/serine-rich 2
MSHFGRTGPPDIRDTFSLLVLNISFRERDLTLAPPPPSVSNRFLLIFVFTLCSGTTADDLFPLFERCGKVVDVFIPRDRRSGVGLNSRAGASMTVSSRFVCRCPRRTGDSRGFAFVRYKYADEAQKAIDRLDGGFFFRLCSTCGDFGASIFDNCRFFGCRP